MNTKHTPGTWSVSKHGTPDYAPQYGVHAEGNQNDHVIVKGERAKADAHLIAAAPELLAALIDVRDNVLNDSPTMWAGVDDAIAKATG